MKLQLVRPGTGLEWLKLGIKTFWSQPLALSALFFLSMALMSVASMVPVIGTALALALLPMASLVMMVAAAEALRERTPTPALLLVAFRSGRERLRGLAVLGACYALGFGLLMLVSSAIDGGEFARVYLGLQPLTPEMAQTGSFQSAMWVAMLLYLPLSLLFWHAPALIHWHGTPPLKAMFFSLVACVRNIGAFMVYGLGWVGMFMLTGAVLAMLIGLLSAVIGTAAGALLVVAAMALAAMFFTSTVFTFRDCFAAPEAATDSQDV